MQIKANMPMESDKILTVAGWILSGTAQSVAVMFRNSLLPRQPVPHTTPWTNMEGGGPTQEIPGMRETAHMDAFNEVVTDPAMVAETLVIISRAVRSSVQSGGTDAGTVR
jgi:hypothetical protein